MEQITEKAIEQTDKKRLLKESLMYFVLFMALDIIMYYFFVKDNPNYDGIGSVIGFTMLIPIVSAILVENGFDFKKVVKSKFNLVYMIFLAVTIIALALKGENAKKTLDTTNYIVEVVGLFVLISALKDKKLMGNLSLKSFFTWIVLILLLKSLQLSLMSLYVQGYVRIHDNILTTNVGTVLSFFGFIAFNLIYGIGEEYGWRRFLQPRLQDSIGKVRGVLLTGLIWGIYHISTYLLFGAKEMVYSLADIIVFCICIGVFLGLCYMKTNSVVLVSILHLVNNVFMAFFFKSISSDQAVYWRGDLSAEFYMVSMAVSLIVFMPFLLAKEYRG